MFDLFFLSAFPYHVIQVIFFITGIYILVKKQLPAWFSKNGSSTFAKTIGWIFILVAPISILLGLLLSYIEALNILFYLDPGLILISALMILFIVNKNKRRPEIL